MRKVFIIYLYLLGILSLCEFSYAMRIFKSSRFSATGQRRNSSPANVKRIPRAQLECLADSFFLKFDLKTKIFAEKVSNPLLRRLSLRNRSIQYQNKKWRMRRGIIGQAHLEVVQIHKKDLFYHLDTDREAEKCIKLNSKLWVEDKIDIWPLLGLYPMLRISEKLRLKLDKQLFCVTHFLSKYLGFDQIEHEWINLNGEPQNEVEAIKRAYRIKDYDDDGEKEALLMHWKWTNKEASEIYQENNHFEEKINADLKECMNIVSTHGSVPQEITVDHLVKHFDENQLFFTEWPNKCDEPFVFSFRGNDELLISACAVCLSDFAVGEHVQRGDHKCNHLFHEDCLQRWLNGHRTCPLCRAKIMYDENDSEENQEAGNP